MPRTIPESIAGAPLTIPDAYDFFDIDATGMPNGDPCLVINPSGLSNPDARAYGTAPTLSPNIFKQAGAGPFSVSWWHKSSSHTSSGAFYMGVQNSSAGTGVDTNNPISFAMQIDANIGIGQVTVQAFNGSSGSTSYVNGGFTFANTWVFNVVGFATPGNPGFTFRVEAPAVPPVSLTTQSNRSAGTSAFASGQNFYIGRYSDTGSPISIGTRVIRLGKIMFHDHLLTLTECQMLYNSMVL